MGFPILVRCHLYIESGPWLVLLSQHSNCGAWGKWLWDGWSHSSHSSADCIMVSSSNQQFCLLLYPSPTKLLGGILVSLRPSVHPSRILCPLCSAYNSGWIHFIFIHLIKQLHKMYRVKSLAKFELLAIFYPRPVMAFGYCRCLRLSVCVCVYVCVCVRQSSVCPDDNLSPAQATITKFGPEVQNTLIKIPIVFGVHWPWPSRSNWT